MPEEQFDLAAINRLVLHKQHLAGGPVPDGIVDVTRHIGGLHNTSPATPYLSLFARVPGFSRDMLSEEMYVRKSLVRIRCMRNTMHILPCGMLPAAFVATRKCTGANAGRFLKYRGVSSDEYDVVSGKIFALLNSGGRTTSGIKKAVGPVTNLPAVLTLMCDRGILVRGDTPNWRSNAYTYHLFSEYLPGLSLDSIDEYDAIPRLALSYFSAFGPATAEDFAWWSGLGKTQVRKALQEMPVVPFDMPGLKGDFFLLQDDLRRLNETEHGVSLAVNLLPGLDPYVMGYKVRERYLSRESYGFVFDRSGNSTNTVLLDGRLSGVWDTDAEEVPVVNYFLFEDVDRMTRNKIEAEAARTGRFIYDQPVMVRECSSMTPLPKRNAGGFMSPLKGQ
jgi:hypothetical protein